MNTDSRYFEVGGMFYHPLNKNIRKTEDGVYQPKKNDVIAVGQIIYIKPEGGMIIAYYEGIYRQQKLNSTLVTSILKKRVNLMFSFHEDDLREHETYFIGNYPIPVDMPYQAYATLDGQQIIDYTGRHTKPSPETQPSYIANHFGRQPSEYLFQTNPESQLGIREELRFANGLEPLWFIKPNQYTPRPQSTAWKVFPEHYPDPQKDIS
jgi:hypothetical protein